MSESLNLPPSTRDVALYGIESSRKVLRSSDIRATQLMLKGVFGGDAIKPLREIPSIELLSPAESTTALLGAGIERFGHPGMMMIMNALNVGVPTDVRIDLISDVYRLQVSDTEDENGERTVGLHIGEDSRHAKHHDILTGIITEFTSTPHEWQSFDPMLPIAKLSDPSIAPDIQALPIDLSVPLGTLFVRRTPTEAL